MSDLIAVDPSIRSAGLAFFSSGLLVDAVRVPLDTRGNAGARCLAMAKKIVDHTPYIDGPLTVAIEWPQIYRAHKSQGDPNDLPGLAAVGVAVAALLDPAELLSFTPAEWAGQLKKVTSGDCRESPRALRIASRLEGTERRIWRGLRRTDHDVIDAIGIGLHALGRLRPRRVFAGASE